MKYIHNEKDKDKIFFYVDHICFNYKNNNIYAKLVNSMRSYLSHYELYQILRIDNRKAFNQMFCWNYGKILDRVNSKIDMDFFNKNYKIADGYKIIEFNDFTQWFYIIGEIKNKEIK